VFFNLAVLKVTLQTGGGFSGINTAIQLKKNFPSAEITIFEKGPVFGGVWYKHSVLYLER
jgi:protoporphyrinogen oxidase